MKKTINTIVFAQAKDNAKVVTANKYVAHALYTQNKALVESLGGTVLKGVGGFQAEFKTVANAKKFIATAITHIDEADYNKARKTEPKAKTEPKPKKVAPTTAKGKAKAEFVTLTDADGNTFKVPTSALESIKTAPKKAKGNAKPTTAPTKAKAEPKAKTPTKAKGNATLTDTQKKYIDICKNSILNRAASAYSIANGGEATTFKALGKTEADLTAYIPNAKAGMLKSKKWTKAVELGITEDMLG